MSLFSLLRERIIDPDWPFLLDGPKSLTARELFSPPPAVFSGLRPGDVVALVGGFDAFSVSAFLHLLDRGMIVAPLSEAAGPLEAFFQAGLVDAVLRQGELRRIRKSRASHPMLEALREKGEGGLIFFSSGTTGEPKAALHAASSFLLRYRTPRPALRTLAFLLFDHIGGINTLLHTLFNNGQIVVPGQRRPEGVLQALCEHAVELLPASPTFLRMLLLGGHVAAKALPSLRLVSYGTERMDQPTLDGLCAALPHVDFRQTYGLSELGILRVVSRARNSLFMRVGGEGVETRVEEGVLHILAKHRMRGYLNAPQPFDATGWHRTGDIVECEGEWLRIVGREGGLINVGGVKVMPADVEAAALAFPGVLLARAQGVSNPITGQHVELLCQRDDRAERGEAADDKGFAAALKKHLAARLPAHALPQRIRFGEVAVSHRFKLR